MSEPIGGFAKLPPREPRRGKWAKGTTRRIVLTSALLSILVLTPLTYAIDSAGGHPAKSAPIVLWFVWFVLLVVVRLLVWKGRRARANDESPAHPEKG